MKNFEQWRKDQSESDRVSNILLIIYLSVIILICALAA